MDHSQHFSDLPPHLRRAAGSIYLALALAALWPWTRVGTIMDRPNPSWAGIAFGVVISLGSAWIFGRRAWVLLTAPSAPVDHPEGDPARWRSPTFYWLAACLFVTLGFAAPSLGMSWGEGLLFLLVGVASAGEGYRVRHYLARQASASSS